MGEMGAGHFIYIPAMILLGVVIGWILGSRAARDAFAAELRRREDPRRAPPRRRRGRRLRRRRSRVAPRQRPRASRLASASGSPASRIRALGPFHGIRRPDNR